MQESAVGGYFFMLNPGRRRDDKWAKPAVTRIIERDLSHFMGH